MSRALLVLGLSLGLGALALAAWSAHAQQAPAAKKAAAVKAGKGEKVCKVRLKYTGQIKTWVCKKEEPCCVWHEISYVKCGSTITGCL
jgi:hypothetical protein